MCCRRTCQTQALPTVCFLGPFPQCSAALLCFVFVFIYFLAYVRQPWEIIPDVWVPHLEVTVHSSSPLCPWCNWKIPEFHFFLFYHLPQFFISQSYKSTKTSFFFPTFFQSLVYLGVSNFTNPCTYFVLTVYLAYVSLCVCGLWRPLPINHFGFCG